MRQIGPYQVVRELGRGAMGVVFEVRGQGGERLALKMILQPEVGAKERFRREAEVLSFLGRHPGIVTFRDAGLEGGHPYLVMDFVEGRTLADALKAGFPRERALEALVGVARALHFAHEAEVVHRDVKPANVLLDRNDRAVLSDFGVAKSLRADRLTLTGEVVGTPVYMAPEQLEGGQDGIERRTDVYGLGAVLYEALSGRRPFKGTKIEVAKQVLMDTPAPLPADIPADLRALCQACMAKSASERPANCEEVARALEAHLRGSADLALAAPRAPARAWTLALGVVLATGSGALGWAAGSPDAQQERIDRAARQEALDALERVQREATERAVALARGRPSEVALELRIGKPLGSLGDAWVASTRLLDASRADPSAFGSTPAAARLVEAADLLLAGVDPRQDADARLIERARDCLVAARIQQPRISIKAALDAFERLRTAPSQRVAWAASPWRELWSRPSLMPLEPRFVAQALVTPAPADMAEVILRRRKTYPVPWGIVLQQVRVSTLWWSEHVDASGRVAVAAEFFLLRPDLPFLGFELGEALVATGRHLEGLILIERALNSNASAGPNANFLLGRMLMEWRRTPVAAVPYLRRGLAPTSDWAYAHLADALTLAGGAKNRKDAEAALVPRSHFREGMLNSFRYHNAQRRLIEAKGGLQSEAQRVAFEQARARYLTGTGLIWKR